MNWPVRISHISRKVVLAGIAGLLIAAAAGWALWSQGGFTVSGLFGAGLLPTRPVLVSGPVPNTFCAGLVSNDRFVNSEAETWLTVNPRSLDSGKPELVGVWQFNRWGTGGSDLLMAAASADGGRTWSREPLEFALCAEHPLRADYTLASDPWVSFGPDGTAYASALLLRSAPSGATAWAVAAATSPDGGRTWENYKVVAESSTMQQTQDDKESVTAHPGRPGTAYLTWTHNVNLDNRRESQQGFIFLSATVDGGKSWSKPRPIFKPPVGQFGLGSTIVIDPNGGTLYHFFAWGTKGPADTPTAFQLAFQRSTDDGQTWTAARVIDQVQSSPIQLRGSGEPVRSGRELPMPAFDATTGRLYLVWADSREAGYDQILLTYSTDGGESWHKPIRASAPGKQPLFRPSMAINRQGQIGLSYYKVLTADPRSGPLMPADLRFALLEPTPDGLGEPRERVVAGPFDLDYAPKAPGPFIGDYMGMVAVDDWFGLLYVEPTKNRKDPTQVRFVGIRP